MEWTVFIASNESEHEKKKDCRGKEYKDFEYSTFWKMGDIIFAFLFGGNVNTVARIEQEWGNHKLSYCGDNFVIYVIAKAIT